MRKAAPVMVALIALLIVTAPLFSCGSNKKFRINEENFYANWMQTINEDTRLKEIVIPGAHDALTSDTVLYKGSVSPILQIFIDNTTCQSASIKELLNSGVRYFDIRVKKHTDGMLYTFHSNIIFEPWSKIIQEIRNYLTESRDFLILDFQHFGKEAAEDTLRAFMEEVDFAKYALPASMDLNTLTMNEIKASGKRFAVIWSENVSIESNYLFPRNEWLKSPYVNSKHLEPQTLIEQLDVYYEGYDNDGLFVLQSQCSTEVGTTPRGLEDIMEPLANEYLLNLSEEFLSKTNIVMRDFVNENDKIPIILSLNLRKNNVKAEYEQFFRYPQEE